MFIGRKNETHLLSQMWGLSKSSMVVCQGRRIIGKSTLRNLVVSGFVAEDYIYSPGGKKK